MAEMNDSLEDNLFQQTSELQSLESIYDKELRILVAEKEFMIDIIPCITDTLQIMLKDAPSLTTQLESSLENSVSGATPTSLATPPLLTVSHLPPVTLYVKYTHGYPSCEPPTCHVSARWLNPELASQLIKEQFNSLFIEGWPVVYEWIDYIKNQLINHYCQLLMTQSNKEQMSSKPCPSDSAHPNQILLRSVSELNDVQEYDNYECHKEFMSGRHDCLICFESKLGNEFADVCKECRGVYCKECFTQYCETCVTEGRVSHMTCPNQSCDHILSNSLLQDILNKEMYAKYCKLVEQAQLDSIPGLVYCPRQTCNSAIVSDASSKLAVCDSCGFPFCKDCRQTWHGVDRCSVFDKLHEIDDKKKDATPIKQKRTDIDELKSMFWLGTQSNVQKCPQCSSTIQKIGGCNKMTCWKCGCGFCWLCRKVISSYDHFSQTGCGLMRDDDYYLSKDNALDNATHQEEQGETASQDELEVVIQSKCPRCNEIHQKTSRFNWVQCRKCSFMFCHLCGEPCFGKFHFNVQYGCPEFSTLDQDLKRLKQ